MPSTHRTDSRYLLFQVAGWGLLALINIFFFITFDRLDFQHIRRMSLTVMLGFSISHIMRYHIKKVGLLRHPQDRQIISFVFITLFYAALWGLLESLVIHLFPEIKTYRRRSSFPEMAYRNMFNGASILFIWNSIYFLYHYIVRSRAQEVDTLRLRALVKELELKTIKSHINPHFIFNALNSIRALIDENPARARDAVTGLGKLLRSSMRSEHLETVTLEEELEIVRDYLALEHIRFEDRLRVEMHIDEATFDLRVPPMMLQTLVENAIKHGVSQSVAGGEIEIRSNVTEQGFEIIVQNSGSLKDQNGRKGFGIPSTENRLKLQYGGQAAFSIGNVEGGFVEARILLPLNDGTGWKHD
jgi:two-component system LytT family sensor kinase